MHDYITFAAARATQADELAGAIERVREQIDRYASAGDLSGDGPTFVGIGASFAAACAPVWVLRSKGIDASRLSAGDFPLPLPTTNRQVVGISQSGRSAETIAALQSVSSRMRFSVVNTSPSPLADVSERSITLGSIEDSYASTIGYTATLAALGMIADRWNRGSIDAGWAALPQLFRETERRLASDVPALVDLFTGATSADFVGAAPSAGSAEAGALLFREVARIPSTGMSTRQYLHGAMESAGGGVHVLFGEDREHEVAATLSNAGHRVILVSTESISESETLRTVRLPAVPPAQRAILEILVMQLLVGEVATSRGIDVEEFVFTNADTKVVV
jgi:glucosamine--fructose-6-phosphate aminotransferase (isomerizing)